MVATRARGDDNHWPDRSGADHCALPGRWLDRCAHAYFSRTAEGHIQPIVCRREPRRRRRQYRHRSGHRQSARWLYHWFRDHRAFRHQPVSLQQDALRSRARHDPGVADLGAAERFRRPHRPCAGENAAGIPGLGEAGRTYQFRKPRCRHLAASVRHHVHQAHRHRCRSCPVPRRGADYSRHAFWRRHVCDRQSCVLCARDPVRERCAPSR